MGYVKELDGIRALAALAVLFFHAGPASPLPGGFLGVDVFFVLSGFLITRALAAEQARLGAIALGRFYLRRLVRLSPPLLLLIAVYLGVSWFVWPDYGTGAHWRDAAVAALYLADYGHAIWRVPDVLRHCWSLSVEEHFYLLWPLVLPLALRAKDPAKILLWGYFVAVAWRVANFAVLDWHLTYYRFDTRLAGILLGGWLALRLSRDSDLPARLGGSVPGLAVGVLTAAMLLFRWQQPVSLLVAMPLVEWASAALICSVVAVPAAGTSWLQRFLGSAPMVRLGVLSYGIYLWHYPISTLTRDALPYGASLAIVLVFAVAMSWLSYETIERPGRIFRHRSRHATSMPATAAA